MEKKITFIIASTLILALILGIVVSGFGLTASSSRLAFLNEGNSRIFTFTSDNSFNITKTELTSNYEDLFFEVIEPADKENITEAKYNITLKEIGKTFPIGVFTEKFKVTAVNASNETLKTTEEVELEYLNSFCRDGPINDTDLILEVSIKNKGEGRFYEWQPLDKIEVEVRLRNNRLDTLENELRDVFFEIGLFEEGTTRNIIEDMIWISLDKEEYDVGDIRGGKSSPRYTFEFRVNTEEVRFDKNYLLVVKAYQDGKESISCIDYSNGLADSELGTSKFFGLVKMRSESTRNKMVVIDDYNFIENPVKASCGEEAELSINIYNVGTRNFEDRIKVRIFNTELGMDMEEIILMDLDSGEKIGAVFYFDVPRGATEKTYPLFMRTYYDYRESDGTYKESSSKTFYAYLKVEDCKPLAPRAIVTPSIESGGYEGEDLVVKAVITNIGDETATYTFNIAGYTGWGESATADPAVLTSVPSGSSREVLITLVPKEGETGIKTFTFEVLQEGKLELTQPIEVEILEKEEQTLFNFSDLFGDNWYLWLIGALNVILVVIIIIVAVKVVKKE
jgi:hypothetical protein